jgi:site-specific DNA-cytosine methylase
VDNPQNIISFCTGYGGIELGIRRAGVDVRVVCNVEIEAFVQANLVAKIEEGLMDDAPIYSDLKTFPASIFRGKICGLIGGYPCQPFSSAGKRKGEDDPRHLWPYIRQHIRAIRPVWCFFENVRGHTTMGLWRVLSDLEEDGYRTEWGLFSAEETGAPHQRIRVFILAKLPHTKIEGLEGYPRLRTKQNRGCESTQNDLSKSELADTSGKGLQGNKLPPQYRKEDTGREEGRHGSTAELCNDGQLGNPASIRPHRGRENCEGEQSEVLRERLESDETRWPARPGEEQYAWEEPRVTEAQSELGGAVDGLTHRVDRLRLLGNGVVPQTAELAWKTLWKEMNS